MWLYIWTELKYSRMLLGISLGTAVALSLMMVADDEADKLEIFWVIIYGISLVISAANFQQEKRERLYTQLPITRTQFTLGDLCVWLIWTALFYAGSSIFYLTAVSPVTPIFFVDLLAVYLYLMGWFGFVGVAIVLSSFRNRYWQIGYIAVAVPLAIFVTESTRAINYGDGVELFIFDYASNFIGIAFLFALTALAAFYLVNSRRDYYLK